LNKGIIFSFLLVSFLGLFIFPNFAFADGIPNDEPQCLPYYNVEGTDYELFETGDWFEASDETGEWKQIICHYKQPFDSPYREGIPDSANVRVTYTDSSMTDPIEICEKGIEVISSDSRNAALYFFGDNASEFLWTADDRGYGGIRVPQSDIETQAAKQLEVVSKYAEPCWDKIEKEIDEAFDEKVYRCPSHGLSQEELNAKDKAIRFAIDPELDKFDPGINEELWQEIYDLDGCEEYFETDDYYYDEEPWSVDAHCQDFSGDLCKAIQCDLEHAKSAKKIINEGVSNYEEEDRLDYKSMEAEMYLDGLKDDLIKVQNCIDELEDQGIESSIEKGVEQATEIGQDTVEKASEVGQIVAEKGTEAAQEIAEVGGCLIATATYGSELAPQVQQLREIRDNKLLQTESGSAFMESFNYFYYSFSPVIADYERENPLFREAIKLAITPMISSLSILNHVDMETDAEVLGYGISLIVLNIGMYFVAPVAVVWQVKKRI
jgi:hypothetical protein